MDLNLLMWELIKLGKKQGCKKLDMWGALGPKASQKDPWYGFHRFKQGYGGKLMEFLGTYDLVLDKKLYPAYKAADAARQAGLQTMTRAKQLVKGLGGWGKKAKSDLLSLVE